MQASIGIILGQRGAGKSRMLFKSLVPLCNYPTLILDTLGGDVLMGVHFDNMPELTEYFLSGNNFSGIYVLNSESAEDSESFFRTVWNLGRSGYGPLWIVVDEVDQFCTSHTVDPYLDKIIRYGRRYGLNCLFASRRVGEINKGVRSQSDFLLSFRQIEPGDVKAVSERTVQGADMLPSLGLWRNTGKHSEFIIAGELPRCFHPVKENVSFIPLNE